MSNHEKSSKHERAVRSAVFSDLSFGILSSFVIRHSGFLILPWAPLSQQPLDSLGYFCPANFWNSGVCLRLAKRASFSASAMRLRALGSCLRCLRLRSKARRGAEMESWFLPMLALRAARSYQ